MSEPEKLAELGPKGQRALEIFLTWVSDRRTGSLTFNFTEGTPRTFDVSNLSLEHDQEGRSLTVME